jgi:hypothetical protein
LVTAKDRGVWNVFVKCSLFAPLQIKNLAIFGYPSFAARQSADSPEFS